MENTKNKEEQYALEKVVERLLKAVEIQRERVGYYFHPHYEVKNVKR